MPNLCLNPRAAAKDPHEFVKKLAANMELLSFSPPDHHRIPTTHIPRELTTCKRVWVRVDRLKRPLEAPYAGPFEVVKRQDKFFTLRYSSGKTENVSLHRLKPVIEVQKTDSDRKEDLIKRTPLVARENDSTNDLPNLPKEETNADSSDNIPLANHEKFAKRIPYI